MQKKELKISEIKGRFLQFIETQNVSVYKFSTETGISKSNFSGKSLESELGGGQISEILTYFPLLNPDWLLLGNGGMLRQNTEKKTLSEVVSLETYEKKVEECALLRAELEAVKKTALARSFEEDAPSRTPSLVDA